jgi:Cyclin
MSPSLSSRSSPDLSILPFVNFLERKLTLLSIVSFGKYDPMNNFYLVSDNPRQSLRTILEHLVEYSPTCFESFLMALIYVERIQETNEGYVNIHTVGKLFALGLMVAEKFLQDHCDSNQVFSKVFMLDLKELNELELEFLRGLSFQCFVSHEKFDGLVALAAALSTAPRKACGNFMPSPTRLHASMSCLSKTSPIST